MKSRIALNLLVLFSLLLSIVGVAAAQDNYKAPSDQPGPAVDKLYFRAFDVDRAPLELEAGSMDMYYYNLKIDAARQLRDNQKVRLIEAPALTLSLILNPAPAPEGQLNPFSILEVRQAVQHLVDREYVAREIYQGQAVPMYTANSPTDYDYLTVFDIIQKANLNYDPEFARAQIKKAMEAAGAKLVDNVWNFNDRPIRIKFVIRVEDERRQVGDLVRTALKDAGFQVEATYQPFAPAIQTVFTTDPQQFAWHIYTEGWGKGSAVRYDAGSVNSYYAPWLGNMPGWQLTGYWQYQNQKLDDLGKKLLLGNFKDRAERDDIYRQMTELGIDESVRVWVATVNSAYALQPDVTGVTEDVAAGPRGLMTTRAAYKPGSKELTIGNLWVWTERSTWNPVGGFADAYSGDIARNLSDPPLINDPFTGIPGPFRATYKVESAGPGKKLKVPEDAFLWDSKSSSWKTVGSSAEAISKVTFDYSKYFSAKFHNGQPITMADLLYSIYQGYDLSYNPDKAKIETVLAVTARPSLETIKGYRIVDDNTIEAYVDYWHFDENYIAAYAAPSSVSTPWELLYALDDLVFNQRRGAYSDSAAARYNVPWISLVLDRDNSFVLRTIRQLQQSKSIPTKVLTLPGASKPLVDADTAVARYQADLDWYDKYNNLMISNGPFFLAKYDPPAQFAELDAFRDASYPFKAADLYKGKPQLIEFAENSAPPISLGDDYNATFTLSGPGKLSLNYLLSNAADGKIIASGPAEDNGNNSFSVKFDADTTLDLDPGLYNLTLAATSDSLAKLTERTFELEADIGLEAPTETATATPTKAATATATATKPPTATATKVPPTATPVPTNTATSVPTNTPTKAPTATATTAATATEVAAVALADSTTVTATRAVTESESVTSTALITASAEVTATSELTTTEPVTATEVATTTTVAASGEMTSTAAITPSEVAVSEAVTATEAVTTTEASAESSAISQTAEITVSEAFSASNEVAASEDVTASEVLSDVAKSAALTDTAELSDTGTLSESLPITGSTELTTTEATTETAAITESAEITTTEANTETVEAAPAEPTATEVAAEPTSTSAPEATATTAAAAANAAGAAADGTQSGGSNLWINLLIAVVVLGGIGWYLMRGRR